MDEYKQIPLNLDWNDLEPKGLAVNFSLNEVIQSESDDCLQENKQCLATKSQFIDIPNHGSNNKNEQFLDSVIDQLELEPSKPQKPKEFKGVFFSNLSQKKNTNITKFYISSFEKEIKRLEKEDQISKSHLQFLEKARKNYASRGRRNIKMQALKILFGEENEEMTKLNRKIFHRLLGTSGFKKYVAQNQFAQDYNKKQHLLASKVYRLRCFSKMLTQRTQSK